MAPTSTISPILAISGQTALACWSRYSTSTSLTMWSCSRPILSIPTVGEQLPHARQGPYLIKIFDNRGYSPIDQLSNPTEWQGSSRSLHPASKTELAEARMIVRTATERPMVLAIGRRDRQVVDVGDAQLRQPVHIGLPVLVAEAAEPVAAVVLDLHVRYPYRTAL